MSAYMNGSQIMNFQGNISLGAGQETESGGIIFNDYETNKNYSPLGITAGTNSQAGILGYHVCHIWVYTNFAFLFVDDFDKALKASEAYAVGDVIQYDAKGHWYNLFKIVAFEAVSDSDRAGNEKVKNAATRIKIERVDGRPIASDGVYLDREAETEERLDNWVYVLNKQGAEPVRFSRAASVSGDHNIGVGHASVVHGAYNTQIGPYGTLSGLYNEGNYGTDVSGVKNIVRSKYSSARGSNNTIEAQADKSHVVGDANKITAPGCHVEGKGLIANVPGLTVLGTYNSDSYAYQNSTPILVVGCGSDDNNRKNAFELYKNGTTYILNPGTNSLDKVPTGYDFDNIGSQLKHLWNVANTVHVDDYPLTREIKKHNAHLIDLEARMQALEGKIQ